LERLGGGGMGVVYKATDLRLDRFVALKFLPASLDSGEEWKKRFTQEAKAASSLDHPNICTIHQIGLTDDGQMFIVMGYYPGETLTTKIERGPLPARDAVKFAIQAAAGLVKAHSSGIVHRDIKPANIIVTTDGVLKILDFGLALLAEDTRITLPGSRLGTPAYMSPEQAQGAAVDHRTDIWSLGVVLYEMISGKHPFKGTYDVAIIYSVINEDPEPIEQSASDAPVEIHPIITRALSKDPGGRYQTVQEMLTDLEHLANRLAAGAPTLQIPRAEPKRTVNKPLVAGVAAALAIAAAAGLYFGLAGDGADTTVQQTAQVAPPAAPESPTAGEGPDQETAAPAAPSETQTVQTAPLSATAPSRAVAEPKAPVRRQEAAAAPLETARRPTSSPSPDPNEAREATAGAPPPGVTAPEPAPPRSVPPEPRFVETRPAPPPEAAPKGQESTELADWARVRDSTDVTALAAFLNKYPTGTLRQEAFGRMEDLKWALARSAGTPAALREFLREFPGGRHSADAESLVRKLEEASSDSAAVLAAIQRLADAYQQRSPDAVKAVWPDLSEAQAAAIGNSLRNARAVKYVLRPVGDPEITNGTAKVACKRSLQFEFAQGAQQPVQDEVSITLRKRGAAWLIENVQTR
jgi:hypothetical protein